MRASKLWLLPLAGAVMCTAHAQQNEDRRLVLTREALRQAQQALQSAESQRATLEREKQALAAELEALRAKGDAAERERRQGVARQAAALAALRGESDRLAQEGTESRRRLEAAGSEIEVLRQREAGSVQALREQRQLTERLVALLEKSTQALADAEAQNDRLATAGEQIVEAYRTKGAGESNAQWEPLFGLATARIEGRAEALRQQIDAARRAPPR